VLSSSASAHGGHPWRLGRLVRRFAGLEPKVNGRQSTPIHTVGMPVLPQYRRLSTGPTEQTRRSSACGPTPHRPEPPNHDGLVPVTSSRRSRHLWRSSWPAWSWPRPPFQRARRRQPETTAIQRHHDFDAREVRSPVRGCRDAQLALPEVMTSKELSMQGLYERMSGAQQRSTAVTDVPGVGQQVAVYTDQHLLVYDGNLNLSVALIRQIALSLNRWTPSDAHCMRPRRPQRTATALEQPRPLRRHSPERPRRAGSAGPSVTPKRRRSPTQLWQ
jgi:hypothetical protein